MTDAARDFVRRRAKHRCEHCHLRQNDAPFVKHQIEHVVPRQHAGGDEPENLALACCRCNKFKGPNLSARDPRTGRVVRLFNPRRQHGRDHFAARGVLVLGRTAVGRATVELLRMNASRRQTLRREVGR